jgi:hypothetical protein
MTSDIDRAVNERWMEALDTATGRIYFIELEANSLGDVRPSGNTEWQAPKGFLTRMELVAALTDDAAFLSRVRHRFPPPSAPPPLQPPSIPSVPSQRWKPGASSSCSDDERPPPPPAWAMEKAAASREASQSRSRWSSQSFAAETSRRSQAATGQQPTHQSSDDGGPPLGAGSAPTGVSTIGDWTLAGWISSQKVGEALAKSLGAAGDEKSSLDDLRLLAADELTGRAALLTRLREGRALEQLVDALWPAVEATMAVSAESTAHAGTAGAVSGAVSGVSGMAAGGPEGGSTAASDPPRFALTGGIELQYGTLTTFFGGLEALLGAPNPLVHVGMLREHTNSADSGLPFVSSNYMIETTSSLEWWFVDDPEGGLAPDPQSGVRPVDACLTRLEISGYPIEGAGTLSAGARPREALPLDSFAEALHARNAQLEQLGQTVLEREELIGSRLYTGPLFVKYNGVLRGKQHAFARARYELLCAGNSYATTLHVINSSIVKLSKLSVACEVYRGVGNGRLPQSFRVPNQYNVRGGIETAFMSTTRDRDVACQYATSGSGAPGVVFSIRQGMIDRGADISWLSQYPHEEEILFGPLTGLEVRSSRIDGSLVMVEVSPSVNLRSETVEQVVGRRRKLIEEAGRNMSLDISSALRRHEASLDTTNACLAQFEAELASSVLSQDAVWFNDDDNLLTALGTAVDTKNVALASGLQAHGLDPLSLAQLGHSFRVLYKAGMNVQQLYMAGACLQELKSFGCSIKAMIDHIPYIKPWHLKQLGYSMREVFAHMSLPSSYIGSGFTMMDMAQANMSLVFVAHAGVSKEDMIAHGRFGQAAVESYFNTTGIAKQVDISRRVMNMGPDGPLPRVRVFPSQT